jgi:hypothetical protein
LTDEQEKTGDAAAACVFCAHYSVSLLFAQPRCLKEERTIMQVSGVPLTVVRKNLCRGEFFKTKRWA